jgi:cytochrome P450
MKVPPGPKGLPIIENLEAFESDRLGFLEKCRDDYGDIVRYHKNTYIVYHPELIETVLKRTNKEFRVGFDVFQRGIDKAHTDDFMKYRSSVSTAMGHSKLKAFLPRMIQIAEEQIDTWQLGDTINVIEEMEKITSRIISQYCFGPDGNKIPELARKMLDALVPKIGNSVVFPIWVPTPTNLRINKQRKLFFDAIAKVFERREGKESKDEMVDYLIGTFNQKDEATRARLVQALGATILAGHRVPASALSWNLFTIVSHPQVEAKVRSELEEVVRRGVPNGEHLLYLSYMQNVSKETIRLYPPTWLMDRQVGEEFELAGYPVTKGQEIMFSPYVVHRDPRFYHQPNMFIPERWEESNGSEKRHTFSYLPFGGGPRVCIGQNISWMILTVVSAVVLSKCKFKLVKGERVKPNPRNTLLPDNLTFYIESKSEHSLSAETKHSNGADILTCPFHKLQI